jgi:hypothetical protein
MAGEVKSKRNRYKKMRVRLIMSNGDKIVYYLKREVKN